MIISVFRSSHKDFAAKIVMDPGIQARVEPRVFEPKIKIYSIESFRAIIRRISWILVPLSAVVRLGIRIPKRAADQGTLSGGFKEIEGN
jgi:hypothetical protein